MMKITMMTAFETNCYTSSSLSSS